MTKTLSPGAVLLERIYFGGALCQVVPARVVAHDAGELVVWVAGGTPVLRRVDPAGRDLRDVPRADWPATLTPATWTGSGVLRRYEVGVDHSVWWFFTDGGPSGPDSFAGWYVNLERHELRPDGTGIDVVDQELDGWVTPDHGWQWKDEESFAAKIGDPGFFTAAEAARIRAEGERVRPLAERAATPFDGTWCGFRPDPSWPLPDRPDAGAAAVAPVLRVAAEGVRVPD